LRDVRGKEKVVMASLVSHGNAEDYQTTRELCQRSFVFKMSLVNIISIRATKDAVRFYDPKNE